jgi:hypothetical protein
MEKATFARNDPTLMPITEVTFRCKLPVDVACPESSQHLPSFLKPSVGLLSRNSEKFKNFLRSTHCTSHHENSTGLVRDTGVFSSKPSLLSR